MDGVIFGIVLMIVGMFIILFKEKISKLTYWHISSRWPSNNLPDGIKALGMVYIAIGVFLFILGIISEAFWS
jgi:vacuolar-type H+-ATPase subunit I/STV1